MPYVYHVPEEISNVRIITEKGDVLIEPGTYITPKALETRIREEFGEAGITFGTLRKQIQNHGLGKELNARRILTLQEAERVIALIGKRGKHERRRE